MQNLNQINFFYLLSNMFKLLYKILSKITDARTDNKVSSYIKDTE